MAYFVCVDCGEVKLITGAERTRCGRCKRLAREAAIPRADDDQVPEGYLCPHFAKQPNPGRGGVIATLAVLGMLVAATGVLWFAMSINAKMARMEMAAAVAEEATLPPPPLVAKKPAAAKAKAATALMAQTQRLPPMEANESLRSFLWYGGVIGGILLLIMSIKSGFLIAFLANVILVFLKLLEGVGRAAELAEKVDRQRHAMDHLLGRPHDHCHRRHSDD
jgi:hypothetical protein